MHLAKKISIKLISLFMFYTTTSAGKCINKALIHAIWQASHTSKYFSDIYIDKTLTTIQVSVVTPMVYCQVIRSHAIGDVSLY